MYGRLHALLLMLAQVTSISTPNGAFACDPDAGKECCITSVRYFVDGCVLYRGVPWNAAMAGEGASSAPSLLFVNNSADCG